MIIDFSAQSSIYSTFDDVENKLMLSEDTVVEEYLVRTLGDMKDLFVNTDGYENNFPLYYMYNGIYRGEHKRFFKDAGIKYEYTVLPSLRIHDEYLKAHGHIHTIRPIKNTRHVEVYEILHGEGYFQMFKETEQRLEVVMMKVKQGDRFLIPGDYFHLSMNTGVEPLIFGDLITNEAANDYTPLKTNKGAPLFGMKAIDGQLVFTLNSNYSLKKMSINYVDIDSLPWKNPVVNIPLYAHFIARPEVFHYLSD